MSFWTWPALRAEVDYRQEQVRRDAAGWRRRRARRRAVEEPAAPPESPPPIPEPRTAGPGERVPVGSASTTECR
ncbi:MAG: hypothetical protein GEV09_17435 [Pseudonocardiaceae bacterium]|nr:hypothetical protein [Pseudonocardiaceae bacterium]